ncbi:LPS export ABC transporter permease LptG [Marinivivus vitaminiproducens]|uniref:LPS export ABC transporter permease LptG n=1 Tax=Marinivivus vitaminiproducens TaxID=3035935 RepID=UPI0027A7D6CC|nr:LPS export ABC transporter permease LptG [Geminicoccaceae bacterium SCSIO 64248]
MSTLGRYVSRTFLVHFVLCLIGFVGLSQVFDLLSNAEDLIRLHGDSPVVMLRYVMLRTPALAAFILPFAVLIGALTALSRLARQNEVTAMKAAGMPFGRLPLMMIPALLVIAALHFLLSEQLVARTMRALYTWQMAGEVARTGEAAQDRPATVWLRAENNVIGIATVFDNGRTLYGVTIFERDAQGRVLAELNAREARYRDREWTLVQGDRLEVTKSGAGTPVPFDREPWATGLTPNQIVALASPVEALPLSDLNSLIGHPELGHRPTYVYQTHWYHGIAAPLASLLMVLLAAPAAQTVSRHGGIALSAIAGIVVGFVFFLVDGLLVALGEAGILPPILAGWTALFTFGCLAGWALINAER